MADTSAYVHSNADNAQILAKASLIEQFDGAWNRSDSSSMMVTISKLEQIRDQLDAEAEAFLTGYSIERAQDIADNAGEFLKDLANQVIYGSSAYEMANTLTKSQMIDIEKLEQKLNRNFKGKEKELATIIKGKITNNLSVAGLTSIIKESLNGKNATNVTIMEGASHVRTLGTLFDVNTINAEFRKNTEVKITDKIFYGTQNLSLKSDGTYTRMIKSLLKTSDVSNLQSGEDSIRAFCKKLGEKMKQLAPEKIPFMWGDSKDKINKLIDTFIIDLTNDLIIRLGHKNVLNDISNVIGALGEGVRESISRVAPNSILITIQMGDLSEEQAVPKVNKQLKNMNIKGSISQMQSFHAAGKQSQTDLVLVNMKTGAVARAQSKNKFASYFTDEHLGDNAIDNFRWKVGDNANLMGFINNLSKTDLGINLNDVDLRNVSDSLANSLWFSENQSATLGGANHINFSGAQVEDVTEEFEGAMEKLMAGQITNLLGVTLDPGGYNINADASNMFYILNGRMKKSSELVQQAIDQMNKNLVKTINSDTNRLVNVTITKGGIPSPNSVGSPSFLPAKKITGPSIGYEMGAKILEGIKITVSLGTSIGTIAKSSLV